MDYLVLKKFLILFHVVTCSVPCHTPSPLPMAAFSLCLRRDINFAYSALFANPVTSLATQIPERSKSSLMQALCHLISPCGWKKEHNLHLKFHWIMSLGTKLLQYNGNDLGSDKNARPQVYPNKETLALNSLQLPETSYFVPQFWGTRMVSLIERPSLSQMAVIGFSTVLYMANLPSSSL